MKIIRKLAAGMDAVVAIAVVVAVVLGGILLSTGQYFG
jgi:hypothetical protein